MGNLRSRIWGSSRLCENRGTGAVRGCGGDRDGASSFGAPALTALSPQELTFLNKQEILL